VRAERAATLERSGTERGQQFHLIRASAGIKRTK
jgi:hypothetical protein